MATSPPNSPDRKNSGDNPTNIKVCVRVRPFNDKERKEGDSLCVTMPTQTNVVVRDSAGIEKPFCFDRAFWSHNSRDQPCDGQDVLMGELGLDLERNAMQGYNSCLFAYGQTGSGKTYSVLGAKAPELRGLLPRVVEDIFQSMEAERIAKKGQVEFGSRVTYVEIYNEVIKDLLCTNAGKLDVRSNPKVGVYIQGLSDVPVFDKKGVQELLEFGAKKRTVGATCMNEQSSRSHCIFTLEVISKRQNSSGGQTQLRAKLNFVDLAGSERQEKARSTGERLKEGGFINQSLSTLALVISKLAEKSDGRKGSADHLPFRNSKLTHCLQDSLNGNSRTVMIAALSPALSNVDENLSTLRFAASVKRIRTKAQKNEESGDTFINGLLEERDQLRAQIEAGKGDQQELADIQLLVQKYGDSFESQLEVARALEEKRKEFLQDAGLSLSEMSQCLGLEDSTPQLVNLSDDPSLSGCLVYFLVRGEEMSCGSASSSKIVLHGLGMRPLMALVTNHDDVRVSLRAFAEGRVLVNGFRASDIIELRNGDRLIFGYSFCFRVVVPLAADDRQLQQQERSTLQNALAEVVPEQTEAYQQCRVYVQDLQSHVGSTRAQHFLIGFQKAMRLADEANNITQDVRPLDRFYFNVEVLIDTFRYERDEPECVVRLKKCLTGARRWRYLIQLHILRKKASKGTADCITDAVGKLGKFRKSTSGKKQLRRFSGGGPEPEPFITVAIWDIDAFSLRMAQFWEAYDVFVASEGRDALHILHPENDPWQVLEPRLVASWLQERDHALRERLETSIEGTPPPDNTVQLSELRGEHDKQNELQEKLDQEHQRHEQEKSIWKGIDQAKDLRLNELEARICELDQENARLRAEVAESRGQPRIQVPGVSNGVASPIEVKLKHASQQSAETAHLATKLLGSLCDLQGDLKNQMLQKHVPQ